MTRQQPHHGNVFIYRRPMNPLSMPQQFKLIAFIGAGVGEAGEPDQRYRYHAAIGEGYDQFGVCATHGLRQWFNV